MPDIPMKQDQSAGAFYVTSTPVFRLVSDRNAWKQVKATTLQGAKRLAVRHATGVTFSAFVAKRNAAGEFDVVASLDNSTAITRRRATWKTHGAAP